MKYEIFPFKISLLFDILKYIILQIKVYHYYQNLPFFVKQKSKSSDK